MCPVLDEDGPYEYLGRTYSIKYFDTEEDFTSFLATDATADSQTIDENTFDIEALFSNQEQEGHPEESAPATMATPQQQQQTQQEV